MTKLKLCFLLALTIAVAQAEDRQKPKKESPKKKATPPAELTLPAGAKLIEPGTYTFTDSQGKKWVYRQTPFGLARAEDRPVEAAPTTNVATTAIEDGEIVRFERPGPFGTYRWQKKKTELDEDERAALERSRGKDGAAAKAKQE